MAAAIAAARSGAVPCVSAKASALSAPTTAKHRPGRRMLEIEVVQNTGNIDQFVVNGFAVDSGKCEAEQVSAVRMLENMRGQLITCSLYGVARQP